MPQPLPVDVVSTWWDYIVDFADILAGLGTLGALIVAVVVYRRQVEEAKLAQSSRVVFDATFKILPGSGEGLEITSEVDNLSDLPVFGVRVFMRTRTGEYVGSDVCRRIGAGRKWQAVFVAKNVGGVYVDENVIVTFRDAKNRLWQRSLAGVLAEVKPQPPLRGAVVGGPKIVTLEDS